MRAAQQGGTGSLLCIHEDALLGPCSTEGVRVAAAARRVELIRGLADEVSAAGGERIIPIQVDLNEEGAPTGMTAPVM